MSNPFQLQPIENPPMPVPFFRFILTLTLLTATATKIFAESPAYFRAGGGIAADDAAPLPEKIDEHKSLLWKTPLAPGHSTPCVSGDSVYVTTFEKGKEPGTGKLFTVALSRDTGEIRWSREAPVKKIEPYHASSSPATASPACDGERVYSFFGSYGFLCYDLAGKLVWEKPLGPFQDEFGAASSPVLVDGKLVINEDHDRDNFLLCLDAKTGNELWKTPRPGFTRSYSTPVVWTAGERKQLLVTGALQLVSYDLETGKQLWSQDGLARIMNTTPTTGEGLLFISAWSPGGDTDARIAMEPWTEAVRLWDKNKDGKLVREEVDNKEVLDRFFRIDLNQDLGLDKEEWGKYASVFEKARNAFFALRPAASSAGQPEVAWEHFKSIPYVPSPLAYRGVVYLAKEGGIVTAYDAKSGDILKNGRIKGTGAYYASPVAGDGKVYVVSDKGVISVLKAGSEWEVLSSRDLMERTVATPVVSGGKLFVRSEAALYCFGVPK